MGTYSFNIKNLVKIISCTVCIFLVVMGASPASARNLHMGANWQYSESDSGATSKSQNYNASYSGGTSLTDLIDVNGSIRYNKIITDTTESDTVGPSFSLMNSNDIYRLSFSSSYNYTKNNTGPESEGWNWGSRLNSAWSNNLWPKLSFNYDQSGSSRGGIQSETTDNAGLNANWAYLNWLRLRYNASWRKAGNGESLIQSGTLNGNKSFWDNRLNLNYSQFYEVAERDRISRITSGGGDLFDVTVSQVVWEYDDTPANNSAPSLLPDVTNDLLVPTNPATLAIDPDNVPKPMNLILKIDSRDVEVVHLYTTNNIIGFVDSIDWELYESDTISGTSFIPVTSGSLALSDYDQVDQRMEIDFGEVVNSEFIKLVLILPGTLAIPPGTITDLDTMEVFIRDSGSNKTTSEAENWRSNFGLGFRMSETLQFSYNLSYGLREETDTKEREYLMNNAGVAWTPNPYFATRLNASDSRVMLENEEEQIYRSYSLSVSSVPLKTLSLSGGFTRNESHSGSTLERADHSYSFHARAQLYRDLSASFNLSYTNPQKGGGDDSLSSSLYMTARLTPVFLLVWNSSYGQNIDTGTYSLGNTFRLSWRASEALSFNGALDTSYGSDQDLVTGLSLNVGVTPNRKHRLTFGYRIDDKQDLEQAINATWSWVITRVFYFNFSGNYRLADENSWFVSGSFAARY